MPRKLAKLFPSLFLAVSARASEPVHTWGETSERGVPPSFQAWHANFEHVGDYGESWLFIVQNPDGGAVFVLLAVTNLGLRTFDGTVDVQLYTADGRGFSAHHEYRRDAIEGSTEKMDITIGGAHAWGGGDAYHLVIDEPDVKLRLDLANELPSFRFGDGKVTFYADRSAEWTQAINVPRGKATGSVTIGGLTVAIDGVGFNDHGWATIKLPTFLTQWTSLRVFDPRYTLVLHSQRFTEKFGGGDNKFGLLGAGDRLVGSTTSFVLDPSRPRPVEGGQMPTRLDVAVETGGYQVVGTITELRFQQSIDVLGSISLPVRVAIKAFYSAPYLMRYAARYDLDVTDDKGVTEHITGECLVEVDVY